VPDAGGWNDAGAVNGSASLDTGRVLVAHDPVIV